MFRFMMFLPDVRQRRASMQDRSMLQSTTLNGNGVT